ncbi:MAG: indolepyruvate oxidoreductase subunit beta [Peptococcaceae bacterium BRH_c8a]|nr:MAG: indolepyruvate oxidoreductase subunit beta [Peptococcaceae bacterium BRH_c8a]
MLEPVNILMVGAGGQGTILASKVLAAAARAVGYEVKVSEMHGMAQRGGSLVTQVRLGEKVYSPHIAEGEADYIMAFEQLEALHWLLYLKPGGTIYINNQQIDPVPVSAGVTEYPKGIIEFIKERVKNVVVLEAFRHAKEPGSEKAVNVVMLGALAPKLQIEEAHWRKAIADNVPARFLEINNTAFDAGLNAVYPGFNN